LARPLRRRYAKDELVQHSRPRLLPIFLLPGLLLLSGCGALFAEGSSDLAGVGGAAVAKAVTNNATVTTAIGLGVQSLAMTGVQAEARAVHRKEQNEIAMVAGGLMPGAIGTWSVNHTVPLEDDEAGQVVVSREIGTPDLACREIVFSVDTTRHKELVRAFYTATVCKDGQQWKWASAEPATERWGALQ
jgi:hypothetical protein